jgi:hypothetical protein
MMTPDERYHRDVQFKQLVDIMINAIRQAQFTPTELREAAILAAIKYEQRIGPKEMMNRMRGLPDNFIEEHVG